MGLLILQIIKWILIILAAILLFILGLLLILLLVPLRYRGEGQYSSEKRLVSGKISWLCSILSAHFVYNHSFCIRIKLLGITIYDSERKKADDSFEAAAEKETDSARVIPSTATNPSDGPTEVEDAIAEATTIDVPENKPRSPKAVQSKRFFFSNSSSKEKPDQSPGDQVRYYLEIWKQESTQLAWQRLKKKIFAILKSILPGRYRVSGRVGFEDPAITGYLMGVLGALSCVIGSHVSIIPNFNEKELQLQGFLKGKIRLGTLAFHCLTMYFDKEVRLVLKKIKTQQDAGGKK